MTRILHPIAFVAALAATAFLVVVSLGIGIIGADNDPANRMYFAVVAVGIVGALVARFRSRGMALAMIAMAVAQVVVMTIALVGGMGGAASPPLEIVLINAMFVVLFFGVAWLFRRASLESLNRNPA